MIIESRLLPLAMAVLALFGIPSLAQTERRQTASTPQPQVQTPALSSNAGATDPMTNEVVLLRKAVQGLNTTVKEISQRLFAPDSKSETPDDKQKRISASLELLGRAEQRAETMRRQLLDLIEKETSLRSRLTQMDEDQRSDSIERSLSGVGSTRSPELRDLRKRVLDNERRGLEMLFNQTAQARVRLEGDVKEADDLVARLRRRVLPQIEKEIEKLNPN